MPNAPAPLLPPLPPSRQKLPSKVSVVLSGMDPSFDPGLLGFLKQIDKGTMPFFFSDSFKGITRNPQKLCQIIDYVLSRGASVVTHNYYLGPTYASRREPVLRPFHFLNEVTEKLANQAGLRRRHREAMGWIRERL